MATFEATRPTVGAQALGIARAAYEYALDYAKERKAFGKPIIMNQAIAFKLANMATEIDASRLLIWRAAWLARNGGYKNAEGSMSKYKASEVAVRVTEDAIQILGGYGYTREYPVERWHRDAKIHTIFEGTREIQQLVIARAISGLRIEKALPTECFRRPRARWQTLGRPQTLGQLVDADRCRETGGGFVPLMRTPLG